MKKFNEFQSDRFLTISSIVENVVESLPNDKKSEILQEAIGNLLKKGLVGLGKWITGYDDVWGGSTGVSLNIKRSPESQQELDDYLKARVKLGQKTLPNLWGIDPEKEKKAREFWGDIGNIFYKKPETTESGPGRMEKLLGFFNLHLDLHDRDRAHKVLKQYITSSIKFNKRKAERKTTETPTPPTPAATTTASPSTSSVPATPPPTPAPTVTPAPTTSSSAPPPNAPRTTTPAEAEISARMGATDIPVEMPKEEPKQWEPIDTRSMSASEREEYLDTLTPEQNKLQFQHNIKLAGASRPQPVGTKVSTPPPTDAAERIAAVDDALKTIKGDPNQYSSPVGPPRKARKKGT